MTDRGLAIRANNKLAESGIHVRQVLIYAMWALENIHIFSWNLTIGVWGWFQGPMAHGTQAMVHGEGPRAQGTEANGCSVQSQWSKGPVHALVFKGPGSKGPRPWGAWPMRKMPGVQVVLIDWPYRLSKLVISLFYVLRLYMV